MTPLYPDSPDAPWALLARHLTTEATAAERAELRAWVRADPAHLQILTTVTRAWERAGEATASPVLFSPADVEAAWQRFRPLLAAAPPTPLAARTPEPPPAARPPRLPWATRRRGALMRLAAGLALVLGLGYAAARTWFLKPAPATLTYASAGHRQRLLLPDGSTAWLNARSRLRYVGVGAAPAQGARTVQLTGEAYFEVVPNPARPFVVSTATARVRVTGTAFNVRAFAAEDSVEVSVAHGRVWVVRLAVPADSVLLKAGTQVALRALDAPGRGTADQLRRRAVTDPNFRAWQTDTLRFRETSVAQVARTLRATFGTAVALGSPGLRDCRFTGTFAHPRPAQVLAVVAVATGSQLATDGQGGYVLNGAGCAAPASAAGSSLAP